MSKKDKEVIEKLRSDRAAIIVELEGIASAAAAETREFTGDENFKRGELTARATVLEDQEREAVKVRKQARKDKALAEARSSSIWGFGAPGSYYEKPGSPDGLRVTGEHRVYERGNGTSYLYDIACMGFGPGIGGKFFDAAARLQQHSHENHVEAVAADQKYETSRTKEEKYFLEQMIEAKNDRNANRGHAYSYRALSTTYGSGGEFVPPLFETLQWIDFMRAARPLADCQNHLPLPDGTMTVNIPKVTGGTAVGPQSGGQNTPVLEQDLTTAFVTFPVVVKAGSQKISLQLLERSPVDFNEVTFRDLAKAYAQAVDVAVAVGNGGQDVVGILNTTGVNAVTWTSTSTTFMAGLYGRLAAAKAAIGNTLFLPATHNFMTPSIWEFLGAQFDLQNRPLVVPSYNGPFNVAILGTDQAVVEGAIGRRVSGLDTFEDANLPQTLGAGGNQSVILTGRFDENFLYESPVITRALPQTYGNQLAVLLQIYGYIAFTAARYPNANSVIAGAQLATPTFPS